MARKEFPKFVVIAALKRARDETGAIRCEKCGGVAKAFDLDHVNPDGLTGQPTLENCMVMCKSCHAEKTKADVKNIAKAKRREAKHLGVRKPPSIPRRQFDPTPKQMRATKPIEKLAGMPLPRLMRGQQ